MVGSARFCRTATEAQAQRLFLQIDARRQISRALHAKCRAVREFVTGELVYYFRKGPRQGSRYGGFWHGPARVLTHEKTTGSEEQNAPGSVVWITHAGKIIRCAPEQLRHVSHDLRHLDEQINGPHNIHSMLKQVSNQLKYLDLSQDGYQLLDKIEAPAGECQSLGLEKNKQSPITSLDPVVCLLKMTSQSNLMNPYQKVEEKKGCQGVTDLEHLPLEELGNMKMKVGKAHLGETFKKVYEDRDYTNWVCQRCDEHSTKTSEGMKQYMVYLRRRRLMEELGETGKGDQSSTSMHLKMEKKTLQDTDTRMTFNKRQFEEEDLDPVSDWSRVDDIEGEMSSMKHRLENMENMMTKILAAVNQNSETQ